MVVNEQEQEIKFISVDGVDKRDNSTERVVVAAATNVRLTNKGKWVEVAEE